MTRGNKTGLQDKEKEHGQVQVWEEAVAELLSKEEADWSVCPFGGILINQGGITCRFIRTSAMSVGKNLICWWVSLLNKKN